MIPDMQHIDFDISMIGNMQHIDFDMSMVPDMQDINFDNRLSGELITASIKYAPFLAMHPTLFLLHQAPESSTLPIALIPFSSTPFCF